MKKREIERVKPQEIGGKLDLQPVRGMRDYLPDETYQRNYVKNIISKVFIEHGFEEVETPVMEYLEILTGKERYREEEKLIYKFKDKGGRDVGLRYDFTIPLSRLISKHHRTLIFPFRRYQIANVYRGESPQYGRMREFCQCDADIVGTSSMSADAEIIYIAYEIFTKLKLKDFVIKINNRKILDALIKQAKIDETKKYKVYRAMDKVDRVGVDGVNEILDIKGIPSDQRKNLLLMLTTHKTLKDYENLLPDKEGIRELEEIFEYLEVLKVKPKNYTFYPWLARGLDYYTGPIFEVTIPKPKVGSLAGGGRYDNLIGIFCNKEIPASGISIGFERVMIAMRELKLLSEYKPTTKVLVTKLDKNSTRYALIIANEIKKLGIPTEIYTDCIKISKQVRYAKKRGIPYVVIVGPDEIKGNTVTIKNMNTGKQKTVKISRLSPKLFK